MYIISVMIFNFSIRDFGHPEFFKSQFGHPVMKILAKSLLQLYSSIDLLHGTIYTTIMGYFATNVHLLDIR